MLVDSHTLLDQETALTKPSTAQREKERGDEKGLMGCVMLLYVHKAAQRVA